MGGQSDTWWERFQLGEHERIRAALAEAMPAVGWAGTDPQARLAAQARLAEVMTEAVTSAWRRGWQPADLVHMARRELTAVHVELLRRAVGVELAAYPPSTVDARWRSQLDELGVAVAPAGDAAWVTEGLEVHWVDGLQACAGLVRFLGELLAVERLTHLPGTAGAAAARVAPGVDPRILERVRALLAKAESTTFPAEAETFTAGAQSLMARHSIDAALLAAAHEADAGAGGPEPAGVRIWIDSPYESAKVSLLCAVAEANRCRTMWRKAYGVCTVVGFEADLAAVETLFTSLLVQATHAMTREGPRVDQGGRSRTRSFRHSFLLAFGGRIGERLAASARQEEQQAVAEAGGERLLPVLAARSAEVERAVAELFPTLRRSRARLTAWDAEGWASGRAAADRASLGTRGRLPA